MAGRGARAALKLINVKNKQLYSIGSAKQCTGNYFYCKNFILDINKRVSIHSLQVQGVVLDKKQNTIALINNTRSQYFQSHLAALESSRESLDKALSILSLKHTRLGHIDIVDLQNAVKECENTLLLTLKDCQVLLEYAVPVLEEEFRPCASIVKSLKELLYREGVNPTLNDIETYFKLCLLADISVSLQDVLSMLDQYSLKPSRELLEVVIMNMGKHGDIVNATSVVAYLREHSLPITETIFSGLILAHGGSGDVSGIQSVLDAMNSIKINPSHITYGALLEAYGMCGNIDELHRVMNKMEQENIALSHSKVADSLLSLVKWQHSGEEFQNIDKVLDLWTKQHYAVDTTRCVLQMIHAGFAPQAIHILKNDLNIQKNTQNYLNASIYIREMVHARVGLKMLVAMCQEMEHCGLNEYAHLVALESAHSEQRRDLAWGLLTALKHDKKPLRQHYFWPLMKEFTDQGLLECVSKMLSLGVVPDVETLRDHVIPYLNIHNPELTLSMLKHAGLPEKKALIPLILVLLNKNRIEDVHNFLLKSKKYVELEEIIGTLAAVWPYNHKTAIQLFVYLVEKEGVRSVDEKIKKSSATKDNSVMKEGLPDWGGQFLLDYVLSRKKLTAKELKPLFKELHQHHITVGEVAADIIVANVYGPAQEALVIHINDIMDPHLGPPPKEKEFSFIPHPEDMKLEELEAHQSELKAKIFNTRANTRRLILTHAANKNTEKVFELFKEFQENEHAMSGGLSSSIMGQYIEDGNLEALKMYQYILDTQPGFKIDAYKVLDLVTLLIKNSQADEGETILNDYFKSENKNIPTKKAILRNIVNLLTAAADHNYKICKTFFDIMQKENLIDTDRKTLGILIKAKLTERDYTGAVEEFEKIFKKYKQVPLRIELLTTLIHNSYHLAESEDKEQQKLAYTLIERVLECSTMRYSRSDSMHKLLFASAEAEKSDMAQKIVKKLGMQLNVESLKRQCNYYVKQYRTEPLLTLMAVDSKNYPSMILYESLLDIYYKQSDSEKALGLWTDMQEKEVIPSDTFLQSLSNLLIANNKKVPFQIPR